MHMKEGSPVGDFLAPGVRTQEEWGNLLVPFFSIPFLEVRWIVLFGFLFPLHVSILLVLDGRGAVSVLGTKKNGSARACHQEWKRECVAGSQEEWQREYVAGGTETWSREFFEALHEEWG